MNENKRKSTQQLLDGMKFNEIIIHMRDMIQAQHESTHAINKWNEFINAIHEGMLLDTYAYGNQDELHYENDEQHFENEEQHFEDEQEDEMLEEYDTFDM